MNIKITGLSYHRNGVHGNGFHVVLFTWKDGRRTRRMVATVFMESGNLAVLDIDETAAGNIAFAEGNSWRGDDFEQVLRAAILALSPEPRVEAGDDEPTTNYFGPDGVVKETL